MARCATVGWGFSTHTVGVDFEAGNGTISTTTPYSGVYCGKVSSLTSGSAKYWVTRFVTSGISTAYAMFRVRVNTLPTANNSFAGMSNTSGGNALAPISLLLGSGGAITVRHYDSSTSNNQSTTGTLSTGTWYRIEMYVNAVGAGISSYEIRLDGVTIKTGSALTMAGNQLTYLNLGLNLMGESQTTGDIDFDDVIINDTSGSYENTWVGNQKVGYLYPAAAGDSNQWATNLGAASTSNWARQLDPMQNNSNYIYSSTLNQLDLYNLTDGVVPSGATVTCVQTHIRNWSNGTPVETITQRIKTAAGTIDSSSHASTAAAHMNANAANRGFPAMITSYLDPGGTNPWTPTTIDSMQLGVWLSGDAGGNNAIVNAQYAVVSYIPVTTVNINRSPTTIGAVATFPGRTYSGATSQLDQNRSISTIPVPVTMPTPKYKLAKVFPTILCPAFMGAKTRKFYTQPTIELRTDMLPGAQEPDILLAFFGDSYMMLSSAAGSYPYTANNIFGFQFTGLAEGFAGTVFGATYWGSWTQKGYTANSLVWDVLQELGYDTSRMTRYEAAIAGTTTSSWDFELPDQNLADNDPNFYAPPASRWGGIANAIHNHSHPVVIFSLDGNDIAALGSNQTSGFLYKPESAGWDTYITGVLRAQKGRIISYLRRLNPNVEIWIVTYPNWHVDDDVGGASAHAKFTRYPPHADTEPWIKASFATGDYGMMGAQAYAGMYEERDRWAETFRAGYTTANNGIYFPYATVTNANEWVDYKKRYIGPHPDTMVNTMFGQDVTNGSAHNVIATDPQYWDNALRHVNSYNLNRMMHKFYAEWELQAAAYSNVHVSTQWHCLGKDPSYPDIGPYHPPQVGVQNDYLHLDYNNQKKWTKAFMKDIADNSALFRRLKLVQQRSVSTIQASASFLGDRASVSRQKSVTTMQLPASMARLLRVSPLVTAPSLWLTTAMGGGFSTSPTRQAGTINLGAVVGSQGLSPWSIQGPISLPVVISGAFGLGVAAGTLGLHVTMQPVRAKQIVPGLWIPHAGTSTLTRTPTGLSMRDDRARTSYRGRTTGEST